MCVFIYVYTTSRERVMHTTNEFEMYSAHRPPDSFHELENKRENSPKKSPVMLAYIHICVCA